VQFAAPGFLPLLVLGIRGGGSRFACSSSVY
jgi:hypothetical protein